MEFKNPFKARQERLQNKAEEALRSAIGTTALTIVEELSNRNVTSLRVPLGNIPKGVNPKVFAETVGTRALELAEAICDSSGRLKVDMERTELANTGYIQPENRWLHKPYDAGPIITFGPAPTPDIDFDALTRP